MAANCINRKDTERHFMFRKRMPMIWTVRILLLLAFSFSLSAVMPAIGNYLCTNCTVTENCKSYPLTVAQSSRLNLTGLIKYVKWFQEPSMASMKSVFNLDRIKESSRASLGEISDFGVLCFRSGLQYFRCVGGCLITELYKNVKSISTRFVANFKISCRYLLASVINVAAEVSANEITEISLHINGTSEGPMIELNPHEFWWLICASLSVVATLVFILLMLRGPLPPNKSHSETCWSQRGKNMPIENKKSTALCFGKKTKTKMKSSKSPRLGSFIENVDIPVSKEGFRSKELRTTPVRRSMRIRNKNLSPSL